MTLAKPVVLSELCLKLLDQLDFAVSLIELVSGNDADIAYVNPAFARLIGFETGDFIGKPVTYLNKFVPAQQVIEKLDLTLMSQSVSRFSASMVDRHGKILNLNVQAIPCKLQDSEQQFIAFIHEDISELISKQNSAIERCKELAERNKELELLSVHDSLSGLYNRRFLDPEFRRLSGYHARHGTPMAVGFIDIDYFKRFNDRYGHAEGDRAIARVGELLRKHFSRVEDLCARYGGEEFVVIAGEDDDPERVLQHFDSFRQSVENLGIVHEGSECSDYLTVSIGLYFGVPQDNDDPMEILKWADEAMYRAKAAGRNRIESASTSLPERKACKGNGLQHSA